jgi:acyl-CoA thioester hydrolase
MGPSRCSRLHSVFVPFEAKQTSPGFAFVVRSMQIEFRKAARMDDVLDVIMM